MSVPAILGTSFTYVATRNIGTHEQHVELLNRTTVPILRDGARKGHPVASISAVCASSHGGTAKPRLERNT